MSNKAVDVWTIGHFLLGLFLGATMRSLTFAISFLIIWEIYEWKFRKDVKEKMINRVIDVVVGLIGALIGSAIYGLIT